MKVKFEFEEPKVCGECPFYSEPPYSCHNERGNQAHCALKFFKGDMRDVSYRKKKSPECKLRPAE